MAVIAESSTRFSGVVKYEFEPTLGICRTAVVLNDDAMTLKVGAVLGKVTATGKYKLAVEGAADGSEVPVAVLIADGLGLSQDIVLAANTDTNALVLSGGPSIVGEAHLQLGAGITVAEAKAALAAVGITVEASI